MLLEGDDDEEDEEDDDIDDEEDDEEMGVILISLTNRALISRAALFVKVRARMEDGGACTWVSTYAIRDTNILVLPEPNQME